MQLFGGHGSGAADPATVEDARRRGITTIGSGLSIGTAVTARLQIPLVNAERFHGPPQIPRVEAVAGTKTRAAVAPIGDAIRQFAGMHDVSLIVPFPVAGWGGPAALARFDIEIANPDPAELTILINDVARAAAEVDLVLGTVGARFSPDDCQELEREARRIAFEDARRQADIQASVLGIITGYVIASEDLPGQLMPMHGPFGTTIAGLDSCTQPLPTSYTASVQSGSSLTPFDPALHPVQAEAYRRVQVTFAIA
jgi:hypothetical protein